jgi:phage internal scaffolding protein
MKKIETRADGSIRVTTVNNQPSKTDQQFAQLCDINQIIKKYRQTGIISHLSNKTGKYADLSEFKGYQDALQKTINANNAFQSLPSPIRKKFGNDPQELISFLSDPSNNEEAIKLGLKIQNPNTQNQLAKKINDDSNDEDKPKPKKPKQTQSQNDPGE